MTTDAGTAGAQPRQAQQATPGRLAPQTPIGGRYIVEQLLCQSALAEVYDASDVETGAAVSVHLMHPALCAAPMQRQALVHGATATRSIAHGNLATLIEVGVDGEHCFLVTERLRGTTVRLLLERRAQTGSPGFGARGGGTIMAAICDALAALHGRGLPHGALSADAVFISDSAEVKIVYAGLGPALAMAVQSRALPPRPELAPEVLSSSPPSPQTDMVSAGHLLYELLIGQRLTKGGPRPSDVPGVPAAVDELIARAVAPQPDRRPDSVAAFKEAFAASPVTAQQRALAAAATGPSLAQSLDTSSLASMIDPALLADTSERWLISKGKLDYGPFSLADLIEQIRTDQVLPGNMLIDNFTGERHVVEEHPLLGPLVERARQLRDDNRRANAEVVHAKQEKRRGFLLFAVIAAGVLALGGLAYVIVTKSKKEADTGTGPKIAAVGSGEFQAQIRFPEKKSSSSGKKPSGSRKSAGGGDDTLALDMSDEGGGSERLDESVINKVIQQNGGRLGGCLAQNGGGYVKINFIIDGPTGRVTSVQANGQQSGGLYTCLNRVLRGMKFPTVNGPRTRAEFEMEI